LFIIKPKKPQNRMIDGIIKKKSSGKLDNIVKKIEFLIAKKNTRRKINSKREQNLPFYISLLLKMRKINTRFFLGKPQIRTNGNL